jgi:hypothetical protein
VAGVSKHQGPHLLTPRPQPHTPIIEQMFYLVKHPSVKTCICLARTSVCTPDLQTPARALTKSNKGAILASR